MKLICLEEAVKLGKLSECSTVKALAKDSPKHLNNVLVGPGSYWKPIKNFFSSIIKFNNFFYVVLLMFFLITKQFDLVKDCTRIAFCYAE